MVVALAAGVAACGQPATSPTSSPATQPATTATLANATVDQILTRLEQREVHNLHARVAWRQQYTIDLPEDVVTKRGRLWYHKSEPVARFLIHFTEQIRGSRKDTLDERHAFDGRWYIEVQSRTRTFTKREVRRPDDKTNPYKVGEGAFPLPFGQKKEDILREFDVRLVASAANDPPATDHLHLTPRPGTSTSQSYKELDFWVERAGPVAGLPTRVQVTKIDGTGRIDSYITVTFEDAQLNQPDFDGRLFEIRVPDGYQVIEERLEDVPPPAGTSGNNPP